MTGVEGTVDEVEGAVDGTEGTVGRTEGAVDGTGTPPPDGAGVCEVFGLFPFGDLLLVDVDLPLFLPLWIGKLPCPATRDPGFEPAAPAVSGFAAGVRSARGRGPRAGSSATS